MKFLNNGTDLKFGVDMKELMAKKTRLLMELSELERELKTFRGREYKHIRYAKRGEINLQGMRFDRRIGWKKA